MGSVAVYPGSFDPFHKGHLDVVERAAAIFDKVYIMVGHNINKTRLIPADTMAGLIEQSIPDKLKPKVWTGWWGGLTADYCTAVAATHIVRGVRSGADLDAEMAFTQIIRDMSPVETVLLPTGRGVSHVSSSMIRDLYKHDAAATYLYVPRPVYEYLSLIR